MSPITRETLAARIAALEAEKDISIKEAFYLKTMRLLLAEMDKPKPHHNGMMQLSNELADLKRRYAELQEVVGQRNGECDRLINEQQNLAMLVKVLSRSLKKYNHTSDLVKRAIDYLTSNGMMNATDCLRGGLLSAHDQTDTAPTQFESLAGEPVSEPYKLPANTACKEAPAHIWLQTAGVWTENGEFSELTWCSSNQHQDDTLYVRADLVEVKK